MISNSAISKVVRQIAYLIEFEAKAKDEDMDNDGNNKTNAVFKARAYIHSPSSVNKELSIFGS
jgi:hypothetical protein